MSLLDEHAIIFEDVTKKYYLYENQMQKLRAALGFKLKQSLEAFYALRNIHLKIKKGARIGLIGRNGAGKTTLLKLVTGNFEPTQGKVVINGTVQAMMNTGLGFHPEFTGMQNIKAALLYNGLDESSFDKAVKDIIDFVELDQFLHQPLKTYSLGMQARLHFAVATAIQPEILIVDEVLGAGDSYFSAKSADRMKNLTHSGCTLLLVSHSTQQILQFCEQAVWLECGEIIMEGKAIEVVKAYESYAKELEFKAREKGSQTAEDNQRNSVIQSKWLREKILREVLAGHSLSSTNNASISRWIAHEQGLKISNIRLLNEKKQEINALNAGQFLEIETTITAETANQYEVYFMILLFTADGRWLTRNCSEKYVITLNAGENYQIKLAFNQILLGTGQYLFSAGIYKVLNLHDLSTARYYDLLSRSFEFEVQGHYLQDETLFYHPAEWQTVERPLPETIS